MVAFDIAGIGSRFLALLVDSLIQGSVVFIALVASGIVGYTHALQSSPVSAAIVVAGLIVMGFLLLYGYFILFEIFWNGQTPGKRIIGIRVLKDSGRRLSAIESIGRNLLRIVDQLPGLYAIGLLCAVLTKQNKRLGDLVAGSIVVREASLRELKAGWQESAHMQLMAPMGAERLMPDDVVLIETFLQRRHELEANVRYRMAADILRRLDGKLTLAALDGKGVEQILEAAVHERRSKTA